MVDSGRSGGVVPGTVGAIGGTSSGGVARTGGSRPGSWAIGGSLLVDLGRVAIGSARRWMRVLGLVLGIILKRNCKQGRQQATDNILTHDRTKYHDIIQQHTQFESLQETNIY
jgi:hypothetical protein